MFCCGDAEEESGGPPSNQYTAPPRGGPPRGGTGGKIYPYPLFNWYSDIDLAFCSRPHSSATITTMIWSLLWSMSFHFPLDSTY